MQFLDLKGVSTIVDNYKSFSNRNILLNPDFNIDQRHGYITKESIQVYSDPELTNLVNTCLVEQHKVAEVHNTYAKFIGHDTNIYYVSINDIERGYVGSNTYTVDRWKFNLNADICNRLIIHDDYISLKSLFDTNTSFKEIQQIVEDYKYLIGKPLILSAMIRTNYQVTFYINGGEGNIINYDFTNIADENWHTVYCIIPANTTLTYLDIRLGLYTYIPSSYLDIKWVKLEVGKYPTQFEYPNRTLELLKCMRYYQEEEIYYRPSCDNSVLLIPNKAARTVPMYRIPSISISSLSGTDNKFSIANGTKDTSDIIKNIYNNKLGYGYYPAIEVEEAPINESKVALFKSDAEIYN